MATTLNTTDISHQHYYCVREQQEKKSQYTDEYAERKLVIQCSQHSGIAIQQAHLGNLNRACNVRRFRLPAPLSAHWHSLAFFSAHFFMPLEILARAVRFTHRLLPHRPCAIPSISAEPRTHCNAAYALPQSHHVPPSWQLSALPLPLLPCPALRKVH